MARFETEAHDGRLRVPGLYEALLARERDHQAEWDAYVAEMAGRAHPRDRRLLDALEAGQPAVLQGRNMRGWGVPNVPLRRDQAFEWFAVTPDDRLEPAESPED